MPAVNVPIDTYAQTTHVRRTVSTVAQRSNSKVWVNIEWTYWQNDNCYILNVEVERLRFLLSFSDVRSETSVWRSATLTKVFRGFPQFIKKYEASSLNHNHVLLSVCLPWWYNRERGIIIIIIIIMTAQIHTWSPIFHIILRKSHHIRSQTLRSNKALKKHHTFLRELPNIADTRSDILTAK